MSLLTLDNLDIDRLHEVVERRFVYPLPRGSGRTTSMLALMVGEAHLGDPGNVYLYIGENIDWTRTVAQSLADILRKEGFSVTVRDSVRVTLFVGDEDHLVKCFWFIPVSETLRVDIRGAVYDDIFVDLTPTSKNHLSGADWELIESRLRHRFNREH